MSGAVLMNKAWEFAINAHGDQMYGDKPYSYHLQQVVDNVMIRTADNPMQPTYVAVAWLHDTMEDCGVTFKELQDEFGLAIADSVKRLTKTKDMDYNNYLAGCIVSAVAREVKICDTMANLQESFRNNRQKGMLKYPKQLAILTAGLWCDELVFFKELKDE